MAHRITKHGLQTRTPEERREIARKGGQARTARKYMAVVANSPLVNLSEDKIRVLAAMRENDYNATIKEIVQIIIYKSETAKEWSDLLHNLLKLPYIKKLEQDLDREKQKDVIPIVVDVLREAGQEELVVKLYERLRREGWGNLRPKQNTVTVPEVRPSSEQTQRTDGTVPSASVETTAHTEVQDMQPQTERDSGGGS